MQKQTRGSWLIHHTNKLQKVNTQAAYENIHLAGKAGILLSALSASDEIQLATSKVEALASAANIGIKLELPMLLKTLSDRSLIDVSKSGVAVIGVTTSATLQHTADIFDSLNPSSSESASLQLAEHASERPLAASEAKQLIGDNFKLSSAETAVLLDNSENIGFVDAESIGNDKLLFNGNLFRNNSVVKINKVLSSIFPADRERLLSLNQKLEESACIELADAKKMLGEKLFEKVMSVGLYDINIVSNSTEEVGFVTLPAAFRKFSSSNVEDAFDLAKAFVSSITYGMTKSRHSRGKITMVRKLLETLVSGEPVGPVPAIAEDYKILELKNVVAVKPGMKNGRSGPMLHLLKKDIGVLALEAIKKGNVSELSLEALPSAAITRFRGPEDNREISRKKQIKADPSATTGILRVLRGGAFS